MTQQIKKLVLFLFLGVMALNAHALLRIEVTGSEGDIPLAIVPFKVTGSKPAHDVAEIIKADLSRTGKFKLYSTSELPERPSSAATMNMGSWKSRDIRNVVVGRIQATGGRYTIEVELVTPLGTRKILRSIRKSASNRTIRLRAHEIANVIFKAITGIDGVFDTKIAYITSIKDRRGRRTMSLIVADADGYNPVVQRSSRYPIMSPTWSPDGKSLAYVMFRSNGRSAIYLQNVRTKRRRLVSSFKGINGAPSFSPDGTRMALTLSRRGNPEIYVFNLRSGKLKRLTFNTAIDTEAVWSPDSRSLVFTSDRSGTPQVYKISARGGRAIRLTRNGPYNARPSYSPDGKKITMVHNSGGQYNIGVLNLAARSSVRSVTNGRLDESPSFAPNGTMIIYASEYNRRGVLWIVSEDGKVKNRVVLPEGDVREPAWGPKRR